MFSWFEFRRQRLLSVLAWEQSKYLRDQPREHGQPGEYEWVTGHIASIYTCISGLGREKVATNPSILLELIGLEGQWSDYQTRLGKASEEVHDRHGGCHSYTVYTELLRDAKRYLAWAKKLRRALRGMVTAAKIVLAGSQRAYRQRAGELIPAMAATTVLQSLAYWKEVICPLPEGDRVKKLLAILPDGGHVDLHDYVGFAGSAGMPFSTKLVSICFDQSSLTLTVVCEPSA